MNPRVALCACLLTAACGEVPVDVIDAGSMSVVIDGGAASDRGVPLDVTRAPDAVAVDLGAALDAGVTVDAAPVTDRGVAVDAGAPTDRGVAVDVGFDAGRCVYEPVYVDVHGDPRNAAGQIRHCWPGEPMCFCDADNDCYDQAGYTPRCAPGAADAGAPRDTGAAVDTGTRIDVPVVVDTGAPRDTGTPVDTGTTIPGSDPIAYSGSFSGSSGRSSATITVSGRGARSVLVYAPSSRGASPPLVVLFHGTGDTASAIFSESRAQSVADANGVIIVAPQALDNRPSDWDHPDSQGVWWLTYPNVDPNTNEDLLLTRALLVEARRRYNVDPARVYAIGHSNGAFFATLVASALAERIAGYGTSSGGLIRCANRESCTATASGSTCANLSAAPSQCRCTGIEKPVALRTDGTMPPGYFAHATDDDIVSPYYTCALASRMTAVGQSTFRTVLRTGDGHSLPPEFLGNAYGYLSAFRR